MKILIIMAVSLIGLAFYQISSMAMAEEPAVIKKWMDTGWLVKNNYVRCDKVWYPPSYVPDKTKCFLKYYKPCGGGGWCRK